MYSNLQYRVQQIGESAGTGVGLLSLVWPAAVSYQVLPGHSPAEPAVIVVTGDQSQQVLPADQPIICQLWDSDSIKF